MPNNSNNILEINKDLYREFQADTVGLKIGCMTTVSKISVSTADNNEGLIHVNPKLATRLLVPSGLYLPYFIQDNLIKLGPSVGILSSAKKPENTFPKGKQGRLFKEMINYGKERGLLIFLFYTEDVNWGKKTVKGYSLNNSGKWVKNNYALPDIVYNRINYRSIESRSNVKTLFKRLENDPNIYLFNSRFLNKWEVHEALDPFPVCKRFLPDTMKFNRKNLKALLAKHREVFLKPNNNSRGQGIIKIIRHSNSYKYSRAGKGSPKWYSASSFYTLSESLSRIGVRENRYLIQEGIDLAQIDNRVFDLRTQVQKNESGKWIMTGVGVRIAGKGRFVTHIPNGGTAASYSETINKAFTNMPTEKNRIEEQLATICMVIPPQLEKSLGINLAILSLDIGIDAGGNLWILEINSKPASFDEDEIRFKHLRHLTDYFIFAAQKIAKE